MILVCDRTISERALRLRERMLKSGYPAAASAFSHIREYRPVKLIVTFGDAFDELRRTPNGDIFAVVIGTQFVNSALNATRVTGEEEAFRVIRESLIRIMGIPGNAVDEFGIFLTPALYWSGYFAELRGRKLELTKTERMIFLYLYVMTDEAHPANVQKIIWFCYPANKQSLDGAENRIAAHITNINAEADGRFLSKLIRVRRGAGYYADHTVV